MASCDFAVKHPAATAAIAGGSLGFVTCGLEVDRLGTCALIGGGTAVFLGLVAGVAIWTMGGDEDHTLIEDPTDDTIHGGASDGSPDGTQVDDPEPAIAAPRPTGPVVPREKQTPIPRLVVPTDLVDAGVPAAPDAVP